MTGSEARIRLERRERIERLFEACPAENYTSGSVDKFTTAGAARMFQVRRWMREAEEKTSAGWVHRYQAKRGQRTRARLRRRDRRLAAV